MAAAQARYSEAVSNASSTLTPGLTENRLRLPRLALVQVGCGAGVSGG